MCCNAAGLFGAGSDALEAPKTVLGRLSCRTAAGQLSALGSMQQQRQAYSTPTSPVSVPGCASTVQYRQQLGLHMPVLNCAVYASSCARVLQSTRGRSSSTAYGRVLHV
jgi:hypothetical protein